jgi:hypothetical protein
MICRIARTIPCLLRQDDRGEGRASNGAEALDMVVSGKHKPLSTNHDNVLDTSKRARGHHEHGTMMDGM